MVATPMTYFAATQLGTGCSVMVTGSHNPPDYNGLKMVIAGDTLSGADIQALRARIERGDLARAGRVSHRRTSPAPTSTASSRGIKLARPLRSRSTPATAWPGRSRRSYSAGSAARWSPMYCEVDGTFPNHHPDPSQPKNLADLIARVGATTASTSASRSTATATGWAW